MTSETLNTICECTDPSCPECAGNCDHKATEILYRLDMDDESGTAFCDQCSADAMHSGVFTDQSQEEEEEEEEEDWEHSAQFMQEFDPSKAGPGLGE